MHLRTCPGDHVPTCVRQSCAQMARVVGLVLVTLLAACQPAGKSRTAGAAAPGSVDTGSTASTAHPTTAVGSSEAAPEDPAAAAARQEATAWLAKRGEVLELSLVTGEVRTGKDGDAMYTATVRSAVRLADGWGWTDGDLGCKQGLYLIGAECLSSSLRTVPAGVTYAVETQVVLAKMQDQWHQLLMHPTRSGVCLEQSAAAAPACFAALGWTNTKS